MIKGKWIYYVVAGGLVLLYYAANATGYDALFLLFGLPVGFWVIWNINPDNPK